MCILIDTCAIISYFSEKDSTHSLYEPLEQWRLKYKRFIVFGGEYYKKEIPTRSLKVLRELEKIGEAIEIDNDLVSKRMQEIFADIPTPKFDDKHILAIIDSCNVKILCTSDERCFTYIKNPSNYNQNKPPFIYKNGNNIKVLDNRKYTQCNGTFCNSH